MLDEDRDRKVAAVREMIEILKSQKSSQFHVMLFKYYIDTEPYSASALTVSDDSTPNLRETRDGFECEAFFPPDVLRQQERQGKDIINGVISVSLYVNVDDIVGIFMTAEKGEPIPLYTPAGC